MGTSWGTLKTRKDTMPAVKRVIGGEVRVVGRGQINGRAL